MREGRRFPWTQSFLFVGDRWEHEEIELLDGVARDSLFPGL